MTPFHSKLLKNQFGSIDVYLFDQLLRGNISPEMCVLDAGCGHGRNSEYLMQCGTDIYCVDKDPERIKHVKTKASTLAPALSHDHVKVSDLSDLPFDASTFDAVICCAVLHFANDETQFEAMVRDMWRVLSPGGLFFARLASSIGIEDHITPFDGRWCHLKDGSDRFLVDEAYLIQVSESLNATFVDPIKTTNVQNLRAMTTWVLRKNS